MTESERNLLSGCVNGDKASWDHLVTEYSALVYHAIRKTLAIHHASLSDDAVGDLYQEFFLSILRDDFKKLRQFKGERGCTLASWLRIVASRLTIDHLRQQRPIETEVSDAIPSGQPDVPVLIAEHEEQQILSKVIEGLTSRDRLIIELSYHQSLVPEEIAGILKISVGALYTQKSRILDKLRDSLQKLPAM